MRLAIMQPYYLPYIGYWQLIQSVDAFVLFDDVNYIKRGWINRNRILDREGFRYINIPIAAASQNKLINELKLHDGHESKERNMRIIHDAYRKAPYYKDVRPFIEGILCNEENDLSKYLYGIIKGLCVYFGIDTKLLVSSQISKDGMLGGKEKILSLCRRMGADTYINAIGGQKLYFKDEFAREGVELKFVKTNAIWYNQFGCAFQPGLSIVDVLMFNSKDQVKKILQEYVLI